MDPKRIAINEWKSAYTAANGTPAPEVDYRNGWFKVRTGFTSWRMKDLQAATQRLRDRAQ